MSFNLLKHITLTSAKEFGNAVGKVIDFMPVAPHRHPTLGVFLGIQFQAEVDLGVWIESRAHQPHYHIPYEGYWGYSQLPAQAIAKNLSITQAREYEGSAQICRVPAGEALEATFDEVYEGEFRGGSGWNYILKDVATGVTTAFGSATSLGGNKWSIPLPILTAEESYSLWVNQKGGGKEYVFPETYEQYTGRTVQSWMQWIHPDTGETYIYEPYFGIGARPYSDEYDDQKFILLKEADIIANGEQQKNPEWVGMLITFNVDGTQKAYDGTYSNLLITAGDGSFPAFSAVHNDATRECLLRISGGVSTTWQRDPRLCGVGSFYTDPENLHLWIGCKIAGRNGEMPCLIHLDELGDAVSEDHSEDAALTSICICARTGNKSVVSIGKHKNLGLENGSEILGITECDFVRLDQSNPQQGLQLKHPGGRSLQFVHNEDGTSEWVFTVETDFAKSQLATSAFAMGLVSYSAQPVEGPEKLLHSTWASFMGSFWCVRRQGEVQELCRLDGSKLLPFKAWAVAAFDARGLVQSGPFLHVFGINSNKEPRLMRVQVAGSQMYFTMNLVPTEHIWRAEPAPKATNSTFPSRETSLMIGPTTGPGGQITGWYLAEPAAPGGTPNPGEQTKVCGFWSDTDQAFNFNPADLVASGFDLEKLPQYLGWRPTPHTWYIEADEPDEPYLEMLVGDGIISYAIVGTMPYDPEIFGLLCFLLGSDGEGEPEGPNIPPTPTCEDASCIYPEMPEGTLVRVIEYPPDSSLEGEIHSVFTCDPTDYSQGLFLERLYPYQWLAKDVDASLSDSEVGELTVDDLAKLPLFNQRCRYAQEEILSSPASNKVYLLQFIPPGYEADVIFKPVR